MNVICGMFGCLNSIFWFGNLKFHMPYIVNRLVFGIKELKLVLSSVRVVETWTRIFDGTNLKIFTNWLTIIGRDMCVCSSVYLCERVSKQTRSQSNKFRMCKFIYSVVHIIWSMVENPNSICETIELITLQ